MSTATERLVRAGAKRPHEVRAQNAKARQLARKEARLRQGYGALRNKKPGHWPGVLFLERDTGFEPATFSLGITRSTTKPLRLLE